MNVEKSNLYKLYLPNKEKINKKSRLLLYVYIEFLVCSLSGLRWQKGKRLWWGFTWAISNSMTSSNYSIVLYYKTIKYNISNNLSSAILWPSVLNSLLSIQLIHNRELLLQQHKFELLCYGRKVICVCNLNFQQLVVGNSSCCIIYARKWETKKIHTYFQTLFAPVANIKFEHFEHFFYVRRLYKD